MTPDDDLICAINRLALTAVGVVVASRLRHAGNWRYCFPIGTPAQRRRVHIALPTSPYPKTPDPATQAA